MDLFPDLLRCRSNVALVDLGCEAERVQGLAEAHFQGGHVDKHECLGVAPKRVLQEVRQFGIAVGNVILLQVEKVF